MADNDYNSIWTLNSAAVKEAIDLLKYIVLLMIVTVVFIFIVGSVANL